jgi:hypothetical protein
LTKNPVKPIRKKPMLRAKAVFRNSAENRVTDL